MNSATADMSTSGSMLVHRGFDEKEEVVVIKEGLPLPLCSSGACLPSVGKRYSGNAPSGKLIPKSP